MHAMSLQRAALVLALIALTFAPASAQDAPASAEDNPALIHIGHLADGFTGTPEGQGLLPTALAEAEVAVRHATLAAADTANLDAIKLHIGHVLHAIDPTALESGPGLGYGLKQAAEGVVRHAAMVWNTEEAARPIRMHAEHVTVSARNVVQRADSIVVLARRIREATAAPEAADLLDDLRAQSDALISGVDANRDGGIGWRRGEGGLEQARQHLEVLKRVAATTDG